MDPLIRRRRLATDYERLVAYVDTVPHIRIMGQQGNPPELFLIAFFSRGIASLSHDSPLYSRKHLVKIRLGGEYPRRIPEITWLTPIFHPNISEDGRWVCIGAWTPARTVESLAKLFDEMIQYRKRDPFDLVNKAASDWARKNKAFLPVDQTVCDSLSLEIDLQAIVRDNLDQHSARNVQTSEDLAELPITITLETIEASESDENREIEIRLISDA